MTKTTTNNKAGQGRVTGKHRATGGTATHEETGEGPKSGDPISISRRQNGHFHATVNLGRKPDGSRHRVHRIRKTEELVRRAAMEAYLSRAPSLAPVASSLTVQELLMSVTARYTTSSEYSTLHNTAWLNQIISLRLGRHRVAALTVAEVESLLTWLSETVDQPMRGAPDERTQDPRYAPATARKVYQRLCRALDVAERDGVVTRNVARDVDRSLLPRVPTQDWVDAWTTDDVRMILATTKALDPALYPLIVMAFASGVRIGELVGARYSDYDPELNTLRAFGTAKEGGGRGRGKTDRAHREIDLPDAVGEVMNRHLHRLARRRDELGAAWGVKRTCGEETREKKRLATVAAAVRRSGHQLDQSFRPVKPVSTEHHTWLFPTPRGTRDYKNNVNKRWGRILKAANLEHRVFHSVRATCITSALEANVPLHEIQAMVGHASPVMTLRYAHRPKKSTAAKRMSAQMGLDGILDDDKDKDPDKH